MRRICIHILLQQCTGERSLDIPASPIVVTHIFDTRATARAAAPASPMWFWSARATIRKKHNRNRATSINETCNGELQIPQACCWPTAEIQGGNFLVAFQSLRNRSRTGLAEKISCNRAWCHAALNFTASVCWTRYVCICDSVCERVCVCRACAVRACVSVRACVGARRANGRVCW